jgi:hypothetical protein
MNVYKMSGGIFPLILNLDTRCRRVVSLTPQPILIKLGLRGLYKALCLEV